MRSGVIPVVMAAVKAPAWRVLGVVIIGARPAMVARCVGMPRPPTVTAPGRITPVVRTRVVSVVPAAPMPAPFDEVVVPTDRISKIGRGAIAPLGGVTALPRSGSVVIFGVCR
jgi:hypothetical protein